MTIYSCGFLFDNLGQVVLIRKNRPVWQAGKLNGVGGHVEDGESFHECMVREFKEEAQLNVSEWQRFAKLAMKDSTIVFYRATVETLNGVVAMTDEPLVFVDSFELPSDTIPNLQWLIPMARVNENSMAEVRYL